MVKGTSWAIRNRVDTRFWEDLWIPSVKEPLQHLVPCVPFSESHFPVAHYANENGWRWDRLKNYLPENICNLIANIKPPSPGHVDFPSWNGSSDGNFTVKSAYSYLFNVVNKEEEEQFPFKLIWKWRGPHCCRLLLWNVAPAVMLLLKQSCMPFVTVRMFKTSGNCLSTMIIGQSFAVQDLSSFDIGSADSSWPTLFGLGLHPLDGMKPFGF